MKQTPRVLAFLVCLAMLFAMLPGAAMVESEPAGTAQPLTAEGGTYIFDGGRWEPDGEVYVGTAEREFREYSTDFFLFKAGSSVVSSGLTSSNESVAMVDYVGDGVWGIGALTPGTTTLSVEIKGVTYAMVMTFAKDSEPGENPGGESGGSDVYDVGNDTELLFKYNNTELQPVSQFSQPIGTSHELYFYHGETQLRNGELTSSKPGVIDVTNKWETEYGTAFNIYVAGPGTATLTYTDGDTVYSGKVTIPEGSAEPEPGPGDDGEEKQLYIHDAWWDGWFTQLPAGNGWHGYFTFHAEEGGERLDPDGRVEFECTEGATAVRATYVGDDPGEEGLVWVDNMYHIEVSGVGRGILKVIVGDVTYTAEVVVEAAEPEPGDGGENYSNTAKITVGGVTYDAAVVDANSSGIFTFLMSSGGFNGYLGCFPGTTYVIGAVSGLFTDEYAEAPARVYDRITGVSVEVASYLKFGADGNQDAPYFAVGTDSYNGIEMHSIQVRVPEGDYFQAKVLVKITVLDENDQPVTYTLPYVFQYIEDVWLDIEMDAATAAELNGILASDEAFYQWMSETNPVAHQLIQTSYESVVPQRILVNLNLPAVTYDGIIKVNITEEKASVFLCGTGDQYGNYTTLPGIWMSGQIFGTRQLKFVADERCQQSYGEESFTCGILYFGTNTNDGFGNAWSTEDCTFSGFDYAVRTTNTGFGMGMTRCVFSDCSYGLYVDASTNGAGNPYVHDSLFIRNTVAVKVNGLPNNFSGYDFRVTNCDFIGNEMDFDVNYPGTFYFHSNYFGRIHQQAEETATDDLILQLADANTEKKLNQVISTHPAQTNTVKGTKIITNPRWKYLYRGWTQYGIAPFALEEDMPYVKVLISDWTQETQIVDKEANGLIIDGSAFDVETEDKKVIDVVDEHENALGTWIFD